MTAEEFNILLRRIDNGDESALEAMYLFFAKQIKCVAYIIVGDWCNATAVLDDVMILLWNKSKKFVNIHSPKACIYDLTKKSACNFYRKYIKKSRRDIYIDDENNNIKDYLIHNDDHSNLDYLYLISRLDPTDKEIINRKIMFNFTFAEIASALRMPEGTVKWKYYQILEKLKKYILRKEESV